MPTTTTDHDDDVDKDDELSEEQRRMPLPKAALLQLVRTSWRIVIADRYRAVVADLER